MDPPSATSQSARKLRSSCDACGIAKTKCDRSQPKCGRCITMKLSCVYGPSRQVGKRPRRRLSVSRDVPSEPAHVTATTGSNGTFNMDGLFGIEGTGALSEMVASSSTENNTHFDPAHFDPTLFLSSLSTGLDGLDGSNDTTLSNEGTNEPRGIPMPPTNCFNRDRIYLEANELLERLTVRGSMSNPNAVLIEMSRVLEVNRSALDSVTKFLKSDFARRIPHLTMLYASIIARVLNWYQEAAGYGHLASHDRESSNSGSTTGLPCGGSTAPSDMIDPPVSNGPPKCFTMQALPFTLGNFNINEPCVQLAFRKQLIRHEMKRVGAVIDELISLAADDKVATCDKSMYLAMGAWLKSEYEKTARVFRDAIRYMTERLEI